MRKIMLLITGISCVLFLHAQGPVQWDFSTKKLDDKTYEVHWTATISSPWKIYSQFTPADGPVPTSFTFAGNPMLVLNKKVREDGDMKKKHEPLFETDVFYYKDKVDFVQTVKLKSKVKTQLNGSLEYMACNDEQCQPPKTVSFSILLQ